MPRTPRKRLAKGIFVDRYSLTGITRIAGRAIERAFPLNTPLEHIKQWQARMALQFSAADLSVVRGTFAHDIDIYLERMRKRPASWKAKRSELRAWSVHFGSKGRHAVRPADIDRVIAEWTTAQVAAKTILNRCRTLRHLYVTLADNRHAPTPLDNVDVPRPVKRRPITVDAQTIKRVEKALRGKSPKNRARFMVMAATGIRPSQLKRLTPGDVDLKKRLVVIPGGKGGLPIVHALNDDMRAAWESFVAADAWGAFDTTSLGKRLREAGWPPGVRPYNARHSIGIELSELGIDLGDIQAWFGHADLATTRNAYVPMLVSRMRKLAQTIEGRLGWRHAPRSTPRAGLYERAQDGKTRQDLRAAEAADKHERPVREIAKQAGKR